MSRKRVRTRRMVLWIVTGFVTAFIFAQSALPQSVSAEESGWIMERIVNPFLAFFGIHPLSHMIVRKLAHIFEFAVLAMLLVPCWKGSVPRCIGTGFATAFFDETIQLFTGRGAQIQDVWIDMIGIAAGLLLGLLLWKALHCRRQSKQQKSQA